MQNTAMQENAVPPLLSLVRDGSSVAQEQAAATVWSLATSHDNQIELVKYLSFYTDIITLLKSGSTQAQYFVAAALAEVCNGYLQARSTSGTSDGAAPPTEVQSQSAQASLLVSGSIPEPAKDPTERRSNVLLTLLDAGGVPPLVKLCEHGTVEGKDKAAACLWHLAMDSELQKSIAASGGIKPLISLLAEGSDEGIHHASSALARLCIENSDNQAQISKRLVSLLDHPDPRVVTRAAHDIQSLAQSDPKAPRVIVSAGAILPLVSVLSNGQTEEGRVEASKTLYTLANSGEANQTAIAIGLVALLGVGTDLAQECVTELLLSLSSGAETDLTNRKAIANAGPFKMLVKQLHSANARVRMLAASVMCTLSGDSGDNVEAIASYHGIQVLVKLLSSGDSDLEKQTLHSITTVLADMTHMNHSYAINVAQEGGIKQLIAIMNSDQTVDCKAKAASVLGSIAMDEQRAREVGDSNATDPLITLLKTDNQSAQQASARALAGMAAGGETNQNGIKEAGGVDRLVELLKMVAPMSAHVKTSSIDQKLILVQSNVSKALAALARDHGVNQKLIADHGGILPLINMVNNASVERPKEEAAGALWYLASNNITNQASIASAQGMESLVALAGKTTARGQEQAAGALYSLALNHPENQGKISELLVQLLRDSKPLTDSQEKAARAISRFARADLGIEHHKAARFNQDSLADASCIGLTASLLRPSCHKIPGTDKQAFGSVRADEEEDTFSNTARHLAQQELCAALWSLSENNENNQQLIAAEGGIPLLIALLEDHPDIHYDAAGALWSLSMDNTNQELIEQAGGIPKLCDLLKYGTANIAAQETATGAIHRLASNANNRNVIADSDGINLLIPLFDGGSVETKEHVHAALLALTRDNPPNQFLVGQGLVNMLASGPEDAQEAQSAHLQSRVRAQTHATHVLYVMSLDRGNRDAFSRIGSVVQLVRQLKSGSEEAQSLASEALTNIARMSADLRIQVTGQLVTLLSSTNADVRQRAGTTLRNNNADSGGQKQQRQAAVSGGVAPLVDLLKAGLNDDRLEAQEYALRSLSMVNDQSRRQSMVIEGCIPAVAKCLLLGKISPDSQEHAITVLSNLSVDRENHDEIISNRGISPLIAALSAEEALSALAKRLAAVGLSHLAAGDAERQELICEAIEPLVMWLVQADTCNDMSLGPQAARTLAAICRGNANLQSRVAQAKAIEPMVRMLEKHAGPEAHEAACGSLATLAVDCPSNQEEIAFAGAVPLLIELIQDRKTAISENAAFAIAMLSDLVNNKILIANKGGIEPLVALLSVGNAAAQQFAARAVSLLAHNNVDNQLALVSAAMPLAELLGSDLVETQEWSQLALLRLALNSINRSMVLGPLVGVLSSRNTSAQLKAAETLETLLELCPAARASIAKAGAIEPLVQLLGNGQRADLFTPPERAAAVLAQLVRLADCKVDVVRAGVLGPLVAMLSNPCKESQAHAACAIWHLSVVAEHKSIIIKLQSIQPLVALLTDGTVHAQKCAARTLWQLSSLSNARDIIVRAHGISALVKCLSRSSEAQRASKTPTDGESTTGLEQEMQEDNTTDKAQQIAAVQEATAAVLSELARTHSSNRALVVEAGGLPLIMDVMCRESASSVTQQHVTSALWGLSQDKPYRVKIAKDTEVVTKMVELLSLATGETQKLAAATLVTLSQDEGARIPLTAVMQMKGTVRDHLQMLQFVKDSWLRSQAEELMLTMSSSEISSKAAVVASASPRVYSPRVNHNPKPMMDCNTVLIPMPTSTSALSGASGRLSNNSFASEVLLARFQAKLEANPTLWMVTRKSEEVTDLHMADLAVQFKVNEKVIVETESSGGERSATVRFIGKVPEIGMGFWIGVEFSNAHGKNDGSTGGQRYFTCKPEHGSFLRPSKLKHARNSSSQTRQQMVTKLASVQATAGRPSNVKGTSKGNHGSAWTHVASTKSKKDAASKGPFRHKEPKQRMPTARMGFQTDNDASSVGSAASTARSKKGGKKSKR